MKEIFVDHFCFSLGDQKKSILDTDREGLLISQVDLLEDAGFKYHHRCSTEQNSFTLARDCVLPIKDQLTDINAIFMANCLPQNSNIGEESQFQKTKDVKYLMDFSVSHLQTELGLNDSFVVGITQQACTGMLFAIRSARALLLSEPDLKAALCLTSDRFPNGALYEQAFNVISDGAAACVVSRKPKGFKYIASHAITNGALSRANDEETVGTYFNYTVRLIEETLQKASLKMHEIDWIVPQNMNRKAWEILASVLGFPAEKIVMPSLSQVAHMISGDNIVNLSFLIRENLVKSGQKILMPVAGYGLNWQSLILEKV